MAIWAELPREPREMQEALRVCAYYKEEQEMEVEALEAIYMEEFTKLSDDPLSYQVHVVPNQDGENNHVAVTLKALVPETYPDVEPKLEILLDKGLSDTQHKEMTQLLEQQMEENMGMAMMYTLCEAVRDYLVENNREGNDGSEHQEMLRRMEQRKKKDDLVEAEKLEQETVDTEKKREFHGTPVTLDAFVAWKEKFETEMRGTEKTSQKDPATAKLTGRQLWNKGLATEDADEDDGVVDAEDADEQDEDEDEDEDKDKDKDKDEDADADADAEQTK